MKRSQSQSERESESTQNRAVFDRSPWMDWQMRPQLILLGDAMIAVLALYLAYQLRFDRPGEQIHDFWILASVLVPSRLLASFGLRLHRWSFKFSNLRDGSRLVLAAVLGTIGFIFGSYFLLRDVLSALPARGVVVLELLLTVAFMTVLRFGPRVAFAYRADFLPGRRAHAHRTLIAGAGNRGELLLRQLQASRTSDIYPIGFVDDDAQKRGHVVGGKPVLGTLDELPKLAHRHRVTQVILAIQDLEPDRLRELLALDFGEPVRFKTLPSGYGVSREEDLREALRDVSPEDLLVRDELTFDHEAMAPAFNTSRPFLVAGAAGSIGREVCRQLLELGATRLAMVDTNENELYVLARRYERIYPDCEILPIVADIRDQARLEQVFALHRPRDVFHAAARKHVPLMEAAPGEAVKTNIVGTRLLVEVAEASGVERFVYMSTDKAVRPTSIMGASKRVGEMVVQAADENSTMRCVSVRFGNVLDSAGSVVPLFREQIAAGGPVTVTHPDIERFFMTISEAVGLVLRATYREAGSLCVLEMGQAIRIVDLANQMITMSGLVPGVDIEIEYTGLRAGEKLYEELIAEGETVVRSIDSKIQVVESPAAPPELELLLEALEQAAIDGDDLLIRRLLVQVVPDTELAPPPPEARLASDNSQPVELVM